MSLLTFKAHRSKILTFKAHRSKIQMAKNFHYHNTEEQLKITISLSKFGMRTFAYQAYFFT